MALLIDKNTNMRSNILREAQTYIPGFIPLFHFFYHYLFYFAFISLYSFPFYYNMIPFVSFSFISLHFVFISLHFVFISLQFVFISLHLASFRILVGPQSDSCSREPMSMIYTIILTLKVESLAEL